MWDIQCAFISVLLMIIIFINILVIEEEGKVMDYLAQRQSFWEGNSKKLCSFEEG